MASKAEAALRERLCKRLTKRNILWWSNPTTMIKGMPDSQGLFESVPFFLEWKAEDGALFPLQKLWLHKLAKGGALALEVRADLACPRPFHAKWRQMLPAGVLGVWHPIDSDEWLEHACYVHLGTLNR